MGSLELFRWMMNEMKGDVMIERGYVLLHVAFLIEI